MLSAKLFQIGMVSRASAMREIARPASQGGNEAPGSRVAFTVLSLDWSGAS
jgi:hypothetical protein